MRDLQPSGKYTPDGLTRVSAEEASTRYTLQPGMVLFQARGASHRAHVLRSLPGPTMASNHFYILRPSTDTITAEYLAWAINSAPVQARIAAISQGSTTMLVPKADFAAIDIPVPPLETQDKITRLAALQQREAELMEYYAALRERLIEEVCVTSARASG
jgi:hypothetical protein